MKLNCGIFGSLCIGSELKYRLHALNFILGFCKGEKLDR